MEKPSATDFNKALKEINKLINTANNKNILIIEGLHPFNNQKMRKMFKLKVYINIPKTLIVKRRLKKFGRRDNQEWYSKNIVIKFYKKYGEPTKKYADLIINGNKSINDNIKKILNHINKIR